MRCERCGGVLGQDQYHSTESDCFIAMKLRAERAEERVWPAPGSVGALLQKLNKLTVAIYKEKASLYCKNNNFIVSYGTFWIESVTPEEAINTAIHGVKAEIRKKIVTLRKMEDEINALEELLEV